MHQEVHNACYDDVELVDQNPEKLTNHQEDIRNVIAQEQDPGNSGNDNTSESNSSKAKKTFICCKGTTRLRNYFQPFDLFTLKKHLYEETQVCSINILFTEITYVNTVLF